MANILTLQVDATNSVDKALINDVDVGEVVSASQNLVRGALQGSLTLKFTEVNVEAAAPAAITATFVGGVSSIAIAISAPALGSGNRFAYKYIPSMSTAPAAPVKKETITGTTNITGDSATVTSGANGDGYLLYELNSQNQAVSYVGHKLTTGEYITG